MIRSVFRQPNWTVHAPTKVPLAYNSPREISRLGRPSRGTPGGTRTHILTLVGGVLSPIELPGHGRSLRTREAGAQ